MKEYKEVLKAQKRRPKARHWATFIVIGFVLGVYAGASAVIYLEEIKGFVDGFVH